jgi:hypothetical protein
LGLAISGVSASAVFLADFFVVGDDLVGLFRGDDRRLLLLLPLLSLLLPIGLFSGLVLGETAVEEPLAAEGFLPPSGGDFLLPSGGAFLVLGAFLAGLPGFSPLRTRRTASVVSI